MGADELVVPPAPEGADAATVVDVGGAVVVVLDGEVDVLAPTAVVVEEVSVVGPHPGGVPDLPSAE